MKVKIKDVRNKLGIDGELLTLIDFEILGDNDEPELTGCGYTFVGEPTEADVDKVLQGLVDKRKLSKEKIKTIDGSLATKLKGKEYIAS